MEVTTKEFLDYKFESEYEKRVESVRVIALYHIKMKCRTLRQIAFLKVNLDPLNYQKLAKLEADYTFHYRECEKYKEMFRNAKLLV